MSDASEPTVRDDPQASRFEVWVGDQRAGIAAYRHDGDTYTFTHTEVDDRFEGQGLGSVLARGTLDAMHAQGASVLPLCPFLRRYIERHDEYLDLVPATQRARFRLPADR